MREFDQSGNGSALTAFSKLGWLGTCVHTTRFSTDTFAIVLLQSPPGVEHRDFLSRLQRETHVLRDLRHPNILPVYDCGYAHEHFYMVTELSTAETLSDRLIAGPLNPQEAGHIVRAVASAVDAIHAKQVFHGDIKPANILIRSQENHALLTGFCRSHFGRAGACGTLFYMAPELFEGQPIDAYAEVYTLGVVAFEILSGRRPFEKESLRGLAAAHRDRVPAPWLGTLCPNVPKWTSTAVGKALCTDRAARFATAVEFAKAAWPDHGSENLEPR